MISLQYNITKEDYVGFCTFVYWEQGKKKRRLIFLKQCCYLIIFLILLFFVGGISSFNNFSVAIYALVFISTLLPLVSGKYSIIRTAEKVAENAENISIFTDYNLTASDSDLLIKTSFTETKYFWHSIIRNQETATHYFLFENALQAIIIPKRACKSEEEKVALNKILSRNLSLESEIYQILQHARK